MDTSKYEEPLDPRDEFNWLYKKVTVDESKGYKNGVPVYKEPHVDIIDRKVGEFVEKGVKFIRYSCEIPSKEFGGSPIKHDIVMTQEAFNKLSASKKKLFMGGI